MATLPTWAVGRHITAVTVTPQSVSNTTAGIVLADVTGAVGTFYGHLEDIAVDQEVETEEISHMGSRIQNHIPISFGTRVRFTEIEKASGANIAANLWNGGYDYFKYVITRGGQSWTGYGAITNYGMQGQKRGVKASLEFVPVNPNFTLTGDGTAAVVTYS